MLQALKKLPHLTIAYKFIKRNRHHDVIISGGGIVGLSMYTSLVSNPMFKDRKITLIERTLDKDKFDLKNPPINYSNPVYAITPSSIRLFKKLNIWSIIEKTRVQCVQKMQIWDSFSEANLSFESFTNDSVMFIVEHDLILSALKEKLSGLQHSQSKILYQSEVSHYKLPATHKIKTQPLLKENFANSPNNIKTNVKPLVEVTLKDGQILTTSLLIGSDGYDSSIRKILDPPCFCWDYHQSSLVATLILEDGCDNNVAWQKFTPQGVIAILPLNSHLSSLVWSVNSANANKLAQCSDEVFVDHLNNVLWDSTSDDPKLIKMEGSMDRIMDMLPFKSSLRLILVKQRRPNTYKQLPPRITGVQEGSRAMVPLKFLYATSFVQDRVALVGDACHRVHPLAGQGLNLGLGDVDCLQRVLEESLCQTADIGDVSHLRTYQTERLRKTAPIVTAINAIDQLYNSSAGNAPTPIKVIRALGLQLADASQTFKQRVINFVS